MSTAVRRWRLPVLAGAIGVAVLLLMVTAIRAASTYYYTLPQFRSLRATAVGRYVQVNGLVAAGVRWNSSGQRLRFVLLAEPGVGGTPASAAAAPLPVDFEGPEPDAFHAGIDVVVAGTLQGNGTFEARQILVKCPSHYSAAPTAASGGATRPSA